MFIFKEIHIDHSLRMTVWMLAAFCLAQHVVAQTTGTCPRSQGEAYLDVGNVRARILNNGALFYRSEPHVYEVPKGSGSNALFATSIWIGGRINGVIHAAATRYGEWEFWPGRSTTRAIRPTTARPMTGSGKSRASTSSPTTRRRPPCGGDQLPLPPQP